MTIETKVDYRTLDELSREDLIEILKHVRQVACLADEAKTEEEFKFYLRHIYVATRMVPNS